METREITQVKIYFLVMNGVWDSAEGGSIAAVSTSKDRLIEFYQSQVIPYEERYRDDMGRYRSFKEGPLYNYNLLMTMDARNSTFGHGLKEEWVLLDDLDDIKHRYHFINE